MAHGNKNEKIVYVGDSRVRKPSGEVSIPPDYTSFPGRSEAFIPNFLLKEWMVGCVVLVGFLVLTIAHPAPLGYPADPTNSAFIPIPDWYFLFLYQLLKYPWVSGSYVAWGVVGIPGVAFGSLLLAPFLDTGKERRFYRRPIASALMILSLASCYYLTKVSWDFYQHELEVTGTVPEHITREEKAREAAMSGKEPESAQKPVEDVALVDADNADVNALLKSAGCISCHGTDLKGQAGAKIPSLRGVGDLLTKEELADIITNGKGNMPAFGEQLSAEEIGTLSDWLAKQKAAAE